MLQNNSVILHYLNYLKLFFSILFGLMFLSISILALAAPLIQSLFEYPSGENIYSFLSPICHQYPTRSFWLLERPFALCARCFSGYLGLGIGLLFIHTNHNYLKRLAIGLLFLIPGVIDSLIQLLTNYESNNIIRFITGLIGGIGVYFTLYPFKSNNNKGV
jgi:uncharacterized membrane protein